MGAGIAAAARDAGLAVLIHDPDPAARAAVAEIGGVEPVRPILRLLGGVLAGGCGTGGERGRFPCIAGRLA